jgi:hypothetical protein
MKIELHQLLSANISDEAAFHVVKFARDLALALESIYFDKMLHHLSVCERNPFDDGLNEDNEPPF